MKSIFYKSLYNQKIVSQYIPYASSFAAPSGLVRLIVLAAKIKIGT
ncbi:MAG: hypothetical protein WCA04_07400 [Geobacteraceae bacterium]